jgi:hypothetical protein
MDEHSARAYGDAVLRGAGLAALIVMAAAYWQHRTGWDIVDAAERLRDEYHKGG